MILIANNTSYLMLSEKDISRYQGTHFVFENSMWKAIEGIYAEDHIKDTTHTLWNIERQREKTRESLVINKNCLIYENPDNAVCTLTLDCKKDDDNREWGRKYEIHHEEHCIIITYKKTNSTEEDSNKEYSFFIAVYAPQLEYLPVQQWKKHEYDADKNRNSPPFHRWVYEAIKFRTSAAISYGFDKAETIKLAKETYENKEMIKKKKEKHVLGIIKNAKSLAEQCCRASLDSMSSEEGIRAGIPWFFEHWARDELVCTKSLLSFHPEIVPAILQKYEKFPIMHKTNGNIIASDAPGWLFLRWKNLMKKQGLSGAQTSMLRAKIQQHLQTLSFEDGLVKNGKKETWMDSIDREGCCIEIQALTLSACKLLNQIGIKNTLEQEIKQAARKHLWNGKYLLDAKNDETTRPNAFIAAYAYPELLSREEWTSCFKNALDKLWLDWGGISTIDKTDKRFVPAHTGENPKSYHNGDSWYWLNNLAGIVLHRNGGFEKYAEKIKNAGEKEITEMGAVGHHAELSSAEKQTSSGCPAQAWSAAMFLELCEEMKK